jgi:hypothetical protein
MKQRQQQPRARKEFRIIFCSFLDVACNFSSRFGREKSRAERTWDDLKGIFFKVNLIRAVARYDTTTDENVSFRMWVDRTLETHSSP